MTAIPWAGRSLTGLSGYKELTGMLFGEFESLVFDTQEFFDVGSDVFIVGTFKFKHRKTGKIADSDFVGRFRMKDGRIVGGQFYENTYAVATARL
jgi:uncharacterized protein